MRRVLFPGEGVKCGDLDTIAYEEDWSLVSIDVEQPAQRQRDAVVSETGDGVRVTFITDYVLDHATFIVVEGERAVAVSDWLRNRGELRIVEPGSVLRDLEQSADPEVLRAAVCRLALLAPREPEETYRRIFSRVLRHADATVRRTAVFSALYPRWDVLRRMLVEMANADPDADLKRLAALALQCFNEDDAPAALYLRARFLDVKPPVLPEWVGALVRTLPAGWQPTGHEAAAMRESVRKEVERQTLSKQFLEHSVARLERAWPVAAGPACRDRLGGQSAARATLWFDPQSSSHLWLDLGLTIPLFWARVDPTIEAIAHTTKFYFAIEHPSEDLLDRRLRFYGGRPTAALGTESPGSDASIVDQLSDRLSSNTALEPLYWGSATPRDPYPPKLGPVSPVALGAIVAEHAKQSPNRAASVSFRTRCSGSVFTVESHFAAVLVVDVAYRTPPHESIAEAVPLPLFSTPAANLPADVLQAMTSLRIVSESQLRAALGTDDDDEELRLIIAAVCADRDDFDDELEDWGRAHESWVRSAAVRIAATRGRVDILREMLSRETDVNVKTLLRATLDGSGDPSPPE